MQTIKVKSCWRGGNKFSFRLEIPGRPWPNTRHLAFEYVPGEKWSRATASDALDLLEKVYHMNRRNIRFHHH